MSRSKWLGFALFASAIAAPVVLQTGPENSALPPFSLEMLTSSKTAMSEVEEPSPQSMLPNRLPEPAPKTAPPAPALRKLASAAPSPPSDRTGMIIALQRELSRVGCYSGASDGEWSPATQEAARIFADGVGAQLPLIEPSHILLTLAEGYRGTACVQRCASGQAPGPDGKCIEVAVKPTLPDPLRTAKAGPLQGIKPPPDATATAAAAQPALPNVSDAINVVAGLMHGPSSRTAAPMQPIVPQTVQQKVPQSAHQVAAALSAVRVPPKRPAEPTATRPRGQQTAVAFVPTRNGRVQVLAATGSAWSWSQPAPIARPRADATLTTYVVRP